MSQDIFDQFDAEFNPATLSHDIAEIEKNGGGSGEYVEVPPGNYEVKVMDLTLKQSKKGLPMLSCRMDILAGEFSGQRIYMNQIVDVAFKLHIANQFLRSLNSGVEIAFMSYRNYNALLKTIFERISGKYEYALEYGRNDNNFPTYGILDVFAVDGGASNRPEVEHGEYDDVPF